jgi:hypothetical protein
VNDKERRLKIRKEVMNHYGNKCNCCGEDTLEFLAIDHINGKGNEHRRKISPKNQTNVSSTVMYRWLIKNNYPDGFQILCHNCNVAKHHHGICPHKKILNNISSLLTT